MRYHFFLHYGWFFQNLEKDFIPILLHMTVIDLGSPRLPLINNIGMLMSKMKCALLRSSHTAKELLKSNLV